MSKNKLYNAQEALHILLEELPSDDDISDIDSSSDKENDDIRLDYLAADDPISSNQDGETEIADDVHHDVGGDGDVERTEADVDVVIAATDDGTNNSYDIVSDTDESDQQDKITLSETFDWKKSDVPYETSNFNFHEGPVTQHFGDCHLACDYFLTFLDEDLRENLLFQTNLYQTQKQSGKSTSPIDQRELFGFLGINFLMGYHKLPSWLDYWKNDPDLGIPFVSEVMSRNRFGQILWNLHVNDNTQIPPNNSDKLYKLRPLIDSLNGNYLKLYDASRYLSIDESMILFKGRDSIKQYNSKKPIKRGYKLWMMADTEGYMNKFEVVPDEFKSFGLGEQVVLNLVNHLHNKDHEVYIDNYFTSLPLLEHFEECWSPSLWNNKS